MTSRTEVPAEFRSSQPMATEKQQGFIQSLLGERDMRVSNKLNLAAADDQGYQDAINTLRAQVEKLTKKEASEWISCLIDFPKIKKAPEAASTGADLPEVPAGHYAVPGEDGALKFYRVDRPAEGKWAGWTFVKVQASDEFHNIKGFAAKRTILAKIAADPRGASAAYGHEIGCCGICGRTLTNEDSRELGIGPVCAGRMGW